MIKETAIEYKDSSRSKQIPMANSESVWEQPIAPFGGMYPYNKVYETESGHLFMMDDTPTHENISLYHRKGTGYIYSSELCNEDEVIEEYTKNFLKRARMEPRKLKWEKKRLYESGKGNTVAIGMSNGFVEPMEANLFAIIINGVTNLAHELKQPGVKTINWDMFNLRIADTYDDIHDFIITHYTLSPRPGAFWDEMRSIGIKEKHHELIRQKYVDQRNSFAGATQTRSLFPDYMWLQMAVDWDIDVSDWPMYPKLNSTDIDFVEEYINKMETTTLAACNRFPNNYAFLKETVFNGG